MTKLTDTQMIILSAAAQRERLVALPLPTRLKGGAVQKVISPLIEKGLLAEVHTLSRGSDPVWREEPDGTALTLLITEAGLRAIGVEPEAELSEAAATLVEAESSATVAPAPKERRSREGTKQALMIGLLRRPEGATLDELTRVTGWQTHTVRGAMAGTLKSKLGLTVASDKDAARGRVYRIQG